MKKFLSMLLALSVVFTYTFGAAGSVFAATEVDDGTTPTTLVEKIDAAKKALKEEAKEAVAAKKATLKAEYTEDFGSNTDAKIAKASYEATLNQIEADLISIVDKAAVKVTGLSDSSSLADVKTAIRQFDIDDILILEDAYVTSCDFDAVKDAIADVTTDNDSIATNISKHYAMFTWNDAMDSMKAQVKAEIEKLDLGLYTSDVVPDGDDTIGGVGVVNAYNKTWNDLAVDKKSAMIKTVDNTAIDMITDAYDDVIANIKAMYDVLNNLTPEKTVTDIDSNVTVTSYKLNTALNIKTKDELETGVANDAATKKSLLASVAAKVAETTAEALSTYNSAKASDPTGAKTAYDTSLKQIAAWEEVLTYLINNDLCPASLDEKSEIDAASDVDDAKWVTIVEKYNKYVALAEGLKVIVEKDGSLKYDAKKIDDNLADAKDAIYATIPATAYVEADAKAALILNAEATESNFEWNKTVKLAAINKEMKETLYDEDGEDKFYAPEKAKMEAAYQKRIDKINAATTQDQLDDATKLSDGRYVAEDAYDNKTAVVTTVKGLNAVTAATTGFIAGVNSNIDYLNFGLDETKDGWRNRITASGDDLTAVAEFLAENGARNNTDVNGMMAKAKDYAASLPTVGETKALAKAADDAIKAIPATVTLADKATVVAAYDALIKTGATVTTGSRLDKAIAAVKAAEKKAIDALEKAISTPVTVADKAAIDAFTAAVEAYEATAMYGNVTADYDADAKFVALRDAAKKDVIDTIAALPADATKEQVEAARAKADAFVADYTDAETGYNAIAYLGQANLDKLVIAEATIKAQEEEKAALEKAEAEKKALETKLAVKDTTARFASSKAYKNSIKLTFKKPAVGVDGYKVYMATKKNGLYKLVGTTTTNTFTKKSLKKGTSYYFKVKAYKVVGEEKVYTQTSGKLCKKTTK